MTESVFASYLFSLGPAGGRARYLSGRWHGGRRGLLREHHPCQFGSEGTGNGQFNRPDALAIDSKGDVWVGDQNNERVQEFNQSGEYLGKFGNAGSGAGQFAFSYPMGIVADTKGDLWVTDTANNRIQKWLIPGYTPSYASAFGSSGTANGQLAHPADVAIDSTGNLWVADENNNRLEQFNEKGEFLKALGSLGSGNGQFSKPKSIAFAANGNFWVADSGNSRLQEFNSSGTFLKAVGAAGSGNGLFNGPESIAIDPKGNIWVADTYNYRVQELNEKGEFLKVVNPTGLGAIEPTGLDVGPGGNVWVADWAHNRVVELSEAGALVRSFGAAGTGNGQFAQPDTVTVDSRGTVWVGDQNNGRIQGFSQSGEYITQFGTKGSGTGQFSFAYPFGIATDAKGNLWIADANNNRVQKWSQPVSGSEIKTEVTVDGKTVDTGAASCAGEHCPLAREWTLESGAYTPEGHTVVVKATDGLGNTTTKTLPIQIQKDATKPTIQAGGQLVQAPEGWVEQQSYTFNTKATDAGYGVTSLALKVDGKQMQAISGACTEGGCEQSLSQAFNTSSLSGGAHPAEIIATDGAGNVASDKWTINVDPRGSISVNEAEKTLEAAEATTDEALVSPLGPGEEVDPLDLPGEESPSISDTASGIHSEGASVESSLPGNPGQGFELSNEEQQLKVEPSSVEPVASQFVPSEQQAVAIATNTSKSVDTVLRPVYDGAWTFESIRDPLGAEEFSWEVRLGPNQSMKQIDEHFVQIYEDQTHPAFAIRALQAHDANGATVPTSIALKDNVITLTVHHRSGNAAAGGQPYVYPVMAGAGWSAGFATVTVTLPPGDQPQPPVSHEFRGYVQMSPPEPIESEDEEASASATVGGGRYKKWFVWVECSHTSVRFSPSPGVLDTVPEYESKCGNPFQNKDGVEVAFRFAMHGKFFQRSGSRHADFEVFHEGDAHHGIGCVAEAFRYNVQEEFRRANVDQCLWWGLTSGGNGRNSATWGHHITAVGRYTGEDRSYCGDSCNGTPNPWVVFHPPPMAYYFWADGHYEPHVTECIDCS